MTLFLPALLAALAAQNDKTQANSHDDAWENGWVTHCRTIYTSTGKNAGMVLQVGDSITHSNPYSQWPRYGAGKTAEDSAVLLWCMAETSLPATQNDATSLNGFYLALADTSGSRGMTAASGLDTTEFVTGNGNGGTAMPSTSVQATARGYVSDGAAYTANLQVDTVAAAFSNAQFAVLMLGTNDAGAGRSTGAFQTDLTAIVDALEAKNIVVVLSTIPPRTTPDVSPYNTVIRAFAQTRGLPLIDYYAEILARRPGTTWQNTLISGDGVHPTATGSSSDPYSPGGNAATHTTGDACLDGGYLLRSWLTVQKLKEVKSYVADGVNPPSGSPPPAPPPPPPSGGGGSAASSSSDDDDSGCSCGTVSAAPGSPIALVLAFLALAFGWPRRRVR